MKIGILSDIHDNIWKLDAALEVLRNVDMIFAAVIFARRLSFPDWLRALTGTFTLSLGTTTGISFGSHNRRRNIPTFICTVSSSPSRSAVRALP